MNKLLLTMLFALSLAGCATTHPGDVKPSVIVEYKYVTSPIPEELLSIPPQVPTINFTADPKPTQKTIARWIADSELRTQMLEKNLVFIKQHQDNESKKQEQNK
jgi:hypothetical protein